ncbi:hypothetical protein M8542_39510 [Amycolatopsis sp. OK19-0408]|uniref:Uncharacterized protein n=1 Tax=Amycolatopsis iheyensis TaxID=2945988 RepID=A0A9X2SNK8_9PSEU|nr:hypothetical protein [Amycolatopsis iheyensis]MCR6488934.1 hypothetical protein [Amycolatopsis iheyensis]
MKWRIIGGELQMTFRTKALLVSGILVAWVGAVVILAVLGQVTAAWCTGLGGILLSGGMVRAIADLSAAKELGPGIGRSEVPPSGWVSI